VNLHSLRARLTRIGASAAPRPRHRGLVVRFVDTVDGKPAPLPAVPHREPEARDPRDSLDIVWLDSDGSELRCA